MCRPTIYSDLLLLRHTYCCILLFHIWYRETKELRSKSLSIWIGAKTLRGMRFPLSVFSTNAFEINQVCYPFLEMPSKGVWNALSSLFLSPWGYTEAWGSSFEVLSRMMLHLQKTWIVKMNICSTYIKVNSFSKSWISVVCGVKLRTLREGTVSYFLSQRNFSLVFFLQNVFKWILPTILEYIFFQNGV